MKNLSIRQKWVIKIYLTLLLVGAGLYIVSYFVPFFYTYTTTTKHFTLYDEVTVTTIGYSILNTFKEFPKDETICSLLYVIPIGSVLIFAFYLLCLKFDNRLFIIPIVIVSLALFVCTMIFCLSSPNIYFKYTLNNYFKDVENCTFSIGKSHLFLLSAGLIGVAALPVAILASYIANVGYTGEKPMKYYEKILEIIIQIVCIPLSAFINACGLQLLLCSPYWVGHLVGATFWWRKGEKVEEGNTYNVGESDTLIETTTTHEIKDSRGNTLASFDTKDYEIKHDDGNRYEMSDSEFWGWLYSIFALHLRIISLVISIIALFVPKMYIKVSSPNKGSEYRKSPFLYFDLLIYDK